MSLLYTGATDRVFVGDPSIDDREQFSTCFWYRFTALTDFRRLWTKGIDVKICQVSGVGAINGAEFSVDRSVGSSNYRSAVPYRINSWGFQCNTFDDTKTPRGHIYIGDIDTLCDEQDYDLAEDGTGTVLQDVNAGLMVGNRQAADLAMQGWLANFMWWNRALSLKEAQIIQFNPSLAVLDRDCKIYWKMGHHGSTETVDLSGPALT